MPKLDFTHPRLKADRRVDVVDGDKVFLTSEGRHFIVHGQPAVAVLPYLDGRHTLAEIAEAVADRFPITTVLGAVGRYADFGHLVEGPADGDPATAWWDHLDAGAQHATERLRSRVPVLLAIGDDAQQLAIQELAAQLPEARVLASPAELTQLGAQDLAVVLTDDYLNPALQECNRILLSNGTPWLLARVTGFQLWLGPLLTPRQSGCWACLAQRLAANRQVERFVQSANGAGWSDPGVATMLPATLRAATGLTAAETQRILVQDGSPTVDGTLVTIDLTTLESQRHTLVRQPQCPACGEPDSHGRPGPIELSPQQARFGEDGGHRVRNPSETVARLERHVSPLIGAITGLHRLTEPGDEVSHAYAAGHNFAMLTTSTYLLRRNLRGLSGGKGRTDAQARASAMCEAIERYSGLWRGDEPRRRGALATLGEEAIAPEALLEFSAWQYDNREAWNHRQRSGLHMVPERLDREREIDWTQVWSLTHQRPRLVPSAYCYFGHPDLADGPFCYCDANGNAAGNTLEEAILQGLLELIERDSVAIWWYNRSRLPRVDLDSLEDPYTRTLERYYREMDRSLWVLDITTDLGIPAFAAVSHRQDRPVQDIVLGFGAHVEPRLGVMRALTECNQFLPAVVKRDSDGATLYDFDDPEAQQWWREATLDSEPYVVPAASAPPTDVRRMADASGSDIAEEIRACVQRLAHAGIEVLVLDQSRPDLEIKVAKVIAPGLRHFWRRLGPGRLYEVPVALGRAERPTPEWELNPRSVFF